MQYNLLTFPVSSLKAICIDYIAVNLDLLSEQINTLSKLPNHIKDRILHKICIHIHFWKKLNTKQIWQSLVHPQTVEVNLTYSLVDDDLLSTLKITRNLRELYLTQILDNTFTTKGLLELIPHLKELRVLTLSKCTCVNDDVLISVAKNCVKLTGLDFHSCFDITDTSVCELSQLENLMWVTLSKTKVSNKGVEALIKGPSGENLKELRLADCVNITGHVLYKVISSCPHLEIFVFHGCKMIQDTQMLDLPLKGCLKQIQYTIEWNTNNVSESKNSSSFKNCLGKFINIKYTLNMCTRG